MCDDEGPVRVYAHLVPPPSSFSVVALGLCRPIDVEELGPGVPRHWTRRSQRSRLFGESIVYQDNYIRCVTLRRYISLLPECGKLCLVGVCVTRLTFFGFGCHVLRQVLFMGFIHSGVSVFRLTIDGPRRPPPLHFTGVAMSQGKPHYSCKKPIFPTHEL